uniref:Uncharacterized protein n=1 Tax=Oryza glumipatula TaxID=40148 RepID=A0A0E0AH23_9ORYZ
MIREYLQADKKRRRARRVAAAMLRLRRQRRRPAEDGGAPTWPSAADVPGVERAFSSLNFSIVIYKKLESEV